MTEFKQNNQKISVVIAAYNEASRISNVLKIVENHPLIDEVIVVNDGSKDDTSEVVRQFNVKLVENEKNMGKTLSVKKGIELSKNDIIMLLDADLKGLNNDCINRLARPVLNGKVDWTLSIRSNSFSYMRLAKMDWVSGERVIPKRLLKDPLIWSRPDVGFGLETLMNMSLLNKKTTFRSVYLPSLVNTNKASKVGFLNGTLDEIKMVRQISKVLSLPKVFAQFIKMAYLNQKYSKKQI